MNKTRKRQIADLPPDMVTEVVRRLNNPGNVARARAVAKTWLAANKLVNQDRKAAKRVQVLPALQAAERWLRADTPLERWVMVEKAPGSAPLRVEPGEEDALQLDPNLVWKIDLCREDDFDQTVYPRLSATVVRDTESALYFDPEDVTPGGIQRLWTEFYFADNGSGVLSELSSPEPVVALVRALTFCAAHPLSELRVWARTRRDQPATHHRWFGDELQGAAPPASLSALGEVLSVIVHSDTHTRTTYPVPRSLGTGTEKRFWRLKDVKNGYVVLRERTPWANRFFDDDPGLLDRLLAPRNVPVPAPNTRAPRAARFTGANGKTYNLSMNGVLGHKAMQAQINAAKAKGKRPANSKR